jgi:3-hydroxyisobutyrate dehydrogenase-like beta-hydroxyacid dehydrogenase
MARIAIIGTGVIGSSRAALFASRGYEVCATDPRSDTADKLLRAVAQCRPSLEQQGFVTDDGSPNLVTTPELQAGVVAGMNDELRGIDQHAMLDESDRLLEQLVVAKTAAKHLPGAHHQ